MGASGSRPPTNVEDWFQPDTHSLWAYDRDGDGIPILVAVYEWETAGLRGVHIERAWGDLLELKDAGGEWDADYEMFHSEVIQQEQLGSRQFAELVADGHMHRIGRLPEGFKMPPDGFRQEISSRDAAAQANAG